MNFRSNLKYNFVKLTLQGTEKTILINREAIVAIYPVSETATFIRFVGNYGYDGYTIEGSFYDVLNKLGLLELL